jgi:hypothetical protein
MLLCDNFIETILEIIKYKPYEVFHFFASSRQYNEQLIKKNKIFIASGGIWGGSVVLPNQYFNWHNWADRYISSKFGKHLDDERMSLYFEFNKINVYCITPSLIEHVGNISLVGNPPGRKSKTEIYDGYSINWKKEFNNIENVGFIWGTSVKRIIHSLNKDNREEFLKKYFNSIKVSSLIKEVKSNRKIYK